MIRDGLAIHSLALKSTYQNSIYYIFPKCLTFLITNSGVPEVDFIWDLFFHLIYNGIIYMCNIILSFITL